MGLRLTVAAFAALCLVGCGGGTRWAMVITSDPPDALVHVNSFPRGVTPIEVPYQWIGHYRVELSHPDFQDVDEVVKIGKPWYCWIPFMGLVLDTLPVPVHHEVALHYNMVPLPADEF